VDGFDDGRCVEVFYYLGNHSRPLERENLPGLVSYLLTGAYAPPGGLVEDISPTLGLVARMAPALAIVIVAALLSILPGIGWLWMTYGWKVALAAAFAVITVGVLLDAV
jgi:hypothetical protein